MYLIGNLMNVDEIIEGSIVNLFIQWNFYFFIRIFYELYVLYDYRVYRLSEEIYVDLYSEYLECLIFFLNQLKFKQKCKF